MTMFFTFMMVIVKKNLSTKLKNRKAATTAIIKVRTDTGPAISKLSGKTSKKVMAIKAPDENAKKYCKIRLNLTATSLPTMVETNVTNANTNRIGCPE
jgi:hypothetical protein